MSSKGSASEQQQQLGESAAPSQSCRKRNSPNSGSSKADTPSTTSVAAVGTSSSKLRRIAHSSSEQDLENSDLQQQNSQLPGTSGTSAVAGASSRAGSSTTGRSSHEGVKNELKYLTDFFPDQTPGDRRLTRSQRQFSHLGSTNQPTDNIDQPAAFTSSTSTSVEQPRSGKDRPRTRKSRANVAGRAVTAAEGSRSVSSSEQQPSASSSARSRAHNPATGLCNSFTRCDSATNRVSPASTQQREQGGYRATPQLSAVVQDTVDNTIQNAVTNSGEILAAVISSNASNNTGAAELPRAVNNDRHTSEGHPSHLRNLHRSQAAHTASSFLGAIVPRVQHLLGSAHTHPSMGDLIRHSLGTASQHSQLGLLFAGPASFLGALQYPDPANFFGASGHPNPVILPGILLYHPATFPAAPEQISLANFRGAMEHLEPAGLHDASTNSVEGGGRGPPETINADRESLNCGSGGRSGHAGLSEAVDARVVTIMEGLRSTNEISQVEAASELAEMLLLGNEESLPNLPIKDIVHALIVLLQKEHNFELMLTAARCISNMLEALPRALPIVIDAVPHLLEKLKRIECIDVAEQSLMALEVMSKRNGKNIMAAGGIAATISHVDFFSVPSQRLAFQIAANCATYVSANDFAQVRDALADLTQRLLIEDKRCLESVCVLFCRLVDNMRNHADKLREIAGQNHALLKNVQQLLLVQPCAVGLNTFQALIRMLRTMASKCSDLAVALVKLDFARTIKYLIVGSKEGDYTTFEIVNRPPQHLQELVYLAGELLPRLPSDGIFEIDSVMLRSQGVFQDFQPVQWYWKDNSNQWLPFSQFDSRVIEMAHTTNETEINLQINGNLYKIDLQRMVQQNHATGKERAIQRRASVFSQYLQMLKSKSTSLDEDRRLELMKTEPALLEQVVHLLLPILVEIDGSSSGPALRYESLRVTLRMIYPSDVRVLKDILANLPLPGHIASALASPRSKDLCVVASALQLAHLLLDKFPDIYEPLFKREGVAHEVEKLAKIKLESPASLPPVQSSPAALVTEQDTTATARTRSGLKSRTAESAEGTSSIAKQSLSTRNRGTTQQPNSSVAEAGPSSSCATRVIVSPSGGRHRRKASPESPISRKESRRRATTANFLHSLRLPSFRMPSTTSSATGHPSHESTSPGTALTSFFASMGQPQASMHHYPSGSGSSTSAPTSAHPCSSRARLSTFTPSAVGSSYSTVLMQSSSSGHSSFVLPLSSNNGSALNHQQREKVRQWIRKEAEFLMQTYFSTPSTGVDGTPSLLTRMAAVATALVSDRDVGSAPLIEFKTILLENDVSAFELNYSGVLTSLCTYLTSTSAEHQPPRKLRLKRFAAVFMSLTPDNLRPMDESECWNVFEILVTKLLASVAQHEQFQVKVTDMGGILTGSSAGSLRGAQALRFFQTHQIRCNLRRHPSCRDLKEWRHGHGSIKVDPFTSISAIERYLLDRGIGHVRGEDSSGDEDASDDDEMPSEASVSGANPQPNRIEILINDEKVPGHMSVLQALRQFGQVNLGDNADQLAVATGLWVNTHTLYYRAVAPTAPDVSEEPSPAVAKSPAVRSEKREKRTKIDDKLWIDGEVPVTECPLNRYLMSTLPVELDDPCAPSLILLRCLYALNRFWWALFDDEIIPPTSHSPLLPSTAFHSSKLNAKMGRQLSDFLSVATQQLPKWTGDLIKAVPFIFTFSSRRNYLYCTAFGRDRALMHLVNQTDGGQGDGESGRLTPRLERRKVSVRRDDLLRQAEQTLHHLGSSRAMLEVGFEGEAGTGFGPTLEFYSTVSREIQKASLRLWHGRNVTAAVDGKDGPMVIYTVATSGLYPAVCSSQNAKQRDARLKKFEFIGRLLAQALIDARMLDLPLNPVFFKWLCGEDKNFGLSDLEVFDKHLYQSLRALLLTDPGDFESLEQYFTLPGDENFELVKGGKNRAVTSSNALQFVKLVAHWQLLEGVRREMEAVRRGFETIININDLASFTPDEMEELFCGCSEETWKRTWNESALQSAIKPDHGYTHDSDQIRWLIQMLASYDEQQQRKFLQFVTGSPKLPVGGFRSLNPPLTVVKKSGSYGNGDDELPSAMTCYNYLKIPAYSSYEIFRKRFDIALRFIYSFHLT